MSERLRKGTCVRTCVRVRVMEGAAGAPAGAPDPLGQQGETGPPDKLFAVTALLR